MKDYSYPSSYIEG